MSPVEKHKDTPNARHRSFKGCWTCKKKRVQCDEVRPSCQRCSLRGITCEGYEIRLRWGAGIASRGKYSGAEKPVKESIPPRSKRRWDMRGKREESEEGDRQGQPMLIAQTEEAQTGLVAERATVNILNSAWEPTQADHIAAVKKHFEIPVSLAALPGMDAHMYGQEVEYPQLSGRRSILA
ncbi:hypothetical protein N7499_012562 [Penicillium canescens]|uniref:Zn(2)-C6 fungal-type domain-containing protein n=1 Tax=Penicillium canescens TaxID=5083 RepID=A0AAD6N4K6_PENCN|nr:uncharacterized protein N7446_000794 [Penicillium canescens]KAJ6030144.1 hypothetical protein N7460_010410 [Penicillium canescens]KAJ6060520.1 hypothetical protein N7444_002374 [Penicillium canescens]KAJ6063882.1 hypothetical protein N7499_012562 [Penicillium canescens]KAJ6077858.1 hypothetical protein N7446_000794 [Penicillium canescens]